MLSWLCTGNLQMGQAVSPQLSRQPVQNRWSTISSEKKSYGEVKLFFFFTKMSMPVCLCMCECVYVQVHVCACMRVCAACVRVREACECARVCVHAGVWRGVSGMSRMCPSSPPYRQAGRAKNKTGSPKSVWKKQKN